MARSRSKNRTQETGAPSLRRDWRHVLPAATLLGAVIVTLLIGAVLQVDETPPARSIEPPPAERHAETLDPDPVSSFPETEAAPSYPEPGRDILDLARRAHRDEQRLAGSGGTWTLQFMMACDPANVVPPAKSLASEQDFYLLSKMHDERACFRLCWGSFASRDLALAANGIPATLSGLAERPQPLPVAKVLQ